MKGCLTTYSFRNDFTGLHIAAFTDFNPTVKTAIETDSTEHDEDCCSNFYPIGKKAITMDYGLTNHGLSTPQGKRCCDQKTKRPASHSLETTVKRSESPMHPRLFEFHCDHSFYIWRVSYDKFTAHA